MKRRLLAALAGILVLCAGCTQIAAPPTQTPAPTPTVAETPRPTPTPWAEPREIPQNYENIGEETYSYHYGNVDVKIKYPYLCGSAEDKELNDLLRQEALGRWLTEDEYDIRCYYTAKPEDAPVIGVGVEGDWVPVRDDVRLLSIYYQQDTYASTVHWDHWGVTLDRAKKRRLSLADIVDTGDDFGAWLYAQDWTALNQWQGGGDEIGKNKEYIEYVLPFYQERSSDPAEHIRDFYITDTDLVIITWEYKYDTRLSVPLSDLTLKGGDLWNV